MSYHIRRERRSKYLYARITAPDGTRGSWKSTRQTTRRGAEIVAKRWDEAAAAGHTIVSLEQAYQLLEQHMRRKRGGQGVSPATLEVLSLKASHITSAFGKERDINSLQVADSEAYLDHRRGQGVQDYTIAKEFGYLVAALKRCFKLGLYKGNYDALWPDTLDRRYRPKKHRLSWEDYVKLIDEIAPQWRDFVIVYVQTGIRFAEIYRLHARDVRGGFLRVRGTKTEGAVRMIPLSVEALEVLQRRTQATTNGQLFECRENMGNQKRAWLRALASACKRAKLVRASTNDLRRTFASWCRANGMDKDAVRRWMGHSSSRMLDEVYNQPFDAQHLAEIAKFPSSVDPQSTQNLRNTQTLVN